MRRVTLTELQSAALSRVTGADAAGQWYRAASSGERVTLSSLHRRALVSRRAWRGADGHADAAYEYRLADWLRSRERPNGR
jgi:hypothetical protein